MLYAAFALSLYACTFQVLEQNVKSKTIVMHKIMKYKKSTKISNICFGQQKLTLINCIKLQQIKLHMITSHDQTQLQLYNSYSQEDILHELQVASALDPCVVLRGCCQHVQSSLKKGKTKHVLLCKIMEDRKRHLYKTQLQ